MWALRQACNPIKKGLSVKTYRLAQAPFEVAGYNLGGCCTCTGLDESLIAASDESLSVARGYSSANDSQKLFMRVRRFSSRTGTQSSGEENDGPEDGFSELEASTDAEAIQHKVMDDDLISEAELSGEDSCDDKNNLPEEEVNLIGTEGDGSEKNIYTNKMYSELFKVIEAAKGSNLSGVLDKWVEEGNEVTRTEIIVTLLNLRWRRMFFKALQLSDWLESSKHLEFNERDYASRLDLVAKVHGVAKAENYIQRIPESFRTEVVYRTLLATYVHYANVKKSEDVFNKMKDLGFPITIFSCNQLILLYKRVDKKKIADVLLLMEKEDVKPSVLTYRILLDAKGLSNDIHGMEKIVETMKAGGVMKKIADVLLLMEKDVKPSVLTYRILLDAKGLSNDIHGMEKIVEIMKADGVMPDIKTQARIARHYISSGFKEKAEAVLKEMEGNDLKENPIVCQLLLPLYAALGKAEEVRRIWQVCDSNPRFDECTAAIEAWGRLHNVEEAEAIFIKMTTKWTKLSSVHYTILLEVYAANKMLAKGKDLVKQMADKGLRLGPRTWDALVKLYVETGEVEKADSVLQKASEQSRVRPLFSSYITIMDLYAKRGDVHNTEKIFHRMRLAGYVSRLCHYHTLMKAYRNGNIPAYGFHERMKADRVFPNKGLMTELSLIDPFKKSAVSNLLD